MKTSLILSMFSFVILLTSCFGVDVAQSIIADDKFEVSAINSDSSELVLEGTDLSDVTSVKIIIDNVEYDLTVSSSSSASIVLSLGSLGSQINFNETYTIKVSSAKTSKSFSLELIDSEAPADDGDPVTIYAGKLTDNNHLGMDYSKENKMILLAGNSGNCINAVSIRSIYNPRVIKSLSSSTSPAVNAGDCRDVKFIDSGKKFVLPIYDKTVEVWSMGEDPSETSDWVELSSYSFTTKQPKKFSQFTESGSSYEFLLSSYGGLIKMSLSKSDWSLSVENTGSEAIDTGSSKLYQDASLIGNDLIVATQAGTGKNVEVYDSSSTALATFILDNASRYMWSSQASDDLNLVALSGNWLALFTYDSSQTGSAKLDLKSETATTAMHRHLRFLNYSSVNYLLASTSSGNVVVYNINDPTSPSLVRDYEITAFDGEAYDLIVDKENDWVFVAGTNGKFAILDLYQLLNP